MMVAAMGLTAGTTASRYFPKLSALALTAVLAPAMGAPLDALLDADPAARYGSAFVEVSADVMNSALDVFKVRKSNGLNLAEGAGDYSGATLRAGFEPAPGWWVDGSLQQRQLNYGADRPHIDSWRLSGQWLVLEQQEQQPATALRLSAWGNTAGELVKSSPTALGPLTCATGSLGCVDRLAVVDPEDRQWQADVVTSWSSGPWILSTFASVGAGKIKVASVRANATVQGVPVSATYANGAFDQSIFDQVAKLYNLGAELQSINYSTRTAQLGLNLAWTQGPWLLRGGYALQHLNRDGVDDVIEAKHKSPVTVNHTLVGEAAYKVSDQLYLFARGQWMKRQFLSDIPFLYNSLTSHRFNQQYGLVSLGVGVPF